MEHEDAGSHALTKPVLTFETGSYKLSEVVKSFPLPVVVQYDSERYPLPFNQFNFDLSQPLLLYKRRNIQKVPARSLDIQHGAYTEVGESLLIPEDYKGWFAVLQRSINSSKADDTVPHFSTVEELAGSNTDKFLVGGSKKIIGLQILERSQNHLKHEQRSFLPGEILSKGKIYYGDTKKKTRLFRKPKYITEKFLMCRDDSDREILLPFEHKGTVYVFYQVSVTCGKPNRNVMQMSDIVAKRLPPRILKLVLGRFPITPCSFTGLMSADTAKLESSVIASTLVNLKNILLEIPLEADMYFRVAKTTDHIRQNQCFLNAMKLCSEKATTYMRNIKVSMNFITDGASPSEGEEQPDTPTQPQFPSPVAADRGRSGDSKPNEDNPDNRRDNMPNGQNDDNPTPCKQIHEYVNTVQYANNVIPERSQLLESAGTRMSEDLEPTVQMRPSPRCRSTGHMSFCLGNGYLTVPMYASDLPPMKELVEEKNETGDYIQATNSKDDLTEKELVCDPKDEGNDETELPLEEGSSIPELPPPKPCTSYVNTADIIGDSQQEVAPQGTSRRRSSTKPPEGPPPPVPTASISSGSLSPASSITSDDLSGKRSSSDSSEYDVPKTNDPVGFAPNKHCLLVKTNSRNDRRPSTFTFSEACLKPPTGSGLKSSNRSSMQSVTSTEDGSDFGDGPIYENISALMELTGASESDVEERLVMNDALPGGLAEEGETNHYQLLWDNETGGAYAQEAVALGEEMCVREPDISHPQLDSEGLAAEEEAAAQEEEARDECEEEKGEHGGREDCRKEGEEDRQQSDVAEIVVAPLQNNDECELASVSELHATDHKDKAVSSAPVDISRCLSNESNSSCSSPREVFPGLFLRKDSCHRVIFPEEKRTCALSVEELSDALREIGLREETVDTLKQRGIDGASLTSAESDEITLRDFLPEVRLVDLKKLSMFIRGWNPHENQSST